MVIYFRYKDSEYINMLVKVVDRYNFDGSYLYFSEAAINILFNNGRWIREE